MSTYNLFQIVDRRIGNARFVDDDSSFQGSLQAVELAEKGSQIRAAVDKHRGELEQLGIDTRAMDQSIAAWNDQIESLWNLQNMAKWKAEGK